MSCKIAWMPSNSNSYPPLAMRRKFPPQLVFDKAIKLTGCEMNLIRNTPGERSPPIVFAREAVIGAMHEITSPQPSWPEIATYFGRMNHSSVIQAHVRFKRWFPRLRAAWLDMVRDECDWELRGGEFALRKHSTKGVVRNG